jgi:hypothetical protein
MTIEVFSGLRAGLRPSFELAEDSALELYQRTGFRMRSIDRDAITVATRYAPGLRVNGIELRDRVWLDRPLHN